MKAALANRKSGKLNCNALRIPVNSDLNLQAWKKYLDWHKDERLIKYLTYGFPLGMVGLKPNQHVVENHFSAKAYPDAVSKFLQAEVKRGAMMGPFEELPYSCCHMSPLMSRPKDVDA